MGADFRAIPTGMCWVDSGLRSVWTNRAGENWAAYFAAHEGSLDRALDVVTDFTGRFDATHGTSLLQKLLSQLP